MFKNYKINIRHNNSEKKLFLLKNTIKHEVTYHYHRISFNIF